MTELQKKIWEVLANGPTGEEVARLFLDYHGNALLDEGFAEFLVDEGVASESDFGFGEE